MSTKTLEVSDLKNMQVETSKLALPSPRSTQLSGAVYPSLAAINMTWARFINRRLKEDLTFPEQLGDCKNLWSVLCVCGAYCRTAAAQYQATFTQLQQIGFNLTSEISSASLVPITASTPRNEQPARSEQD
jgi:hypothetical protein